MKKCIRLCQEDNVATLLNEALPREMFGIFDRADRLCGEIQTADAIPFAHKIALRDIQKGELILKMNTIIGEASVDIPMGTHAHIHNIVSIEGRRGLMK